MACNSTTEPQVGSDLDSTITQSFRDQKQIEIFIRNKRLLKIIEDAAKDYIVKYQNTKSADDALAGVIVKLPFVLTDFSEQFEQLLHLAIEEPVQFADSAKYCVYGLIRGIIKQSSSSSGLKGIDINQVHLQLRFIGLPLQRELLFDSSLHLYRTGLSVLDGILRAYTEPEKFVIQSVWYCETGCFRNKITAENVEAPICSSCSRQMNEYTKLRLSQNFCLLRIQLTKSVQTPRISNRIFRSIVVYIKDHNYDCELTLGTRFIITGYYDYRPEVQKFIAWNLMET